MGTLQRIIRDQQEQLQYIKADMKCVPATEHTPAGYVFRVIDTRTRDVLWQHGEESYYEARVAYDHANMMVAAIRIVEWNNYTSKVFEWW